MKLKNKEKCMSKAEFKRELDKIADGLPKYYGVIVKGMLPEKTMTRIYQVRNYGVVDIDILDAFKKICVKK